MLNQSMILSLLFNDEQIKCAVESQTLLTSCVVFSHIGITTMYLYVENM